MVEIFAPHLKTFTEKYPHIFKSFWKHSYKNPIAQFMIYDGGFNKKQVGI
jgi:hypothetical protein